MTSRIEAITGAAGIRSLGGVKVMCAMSGGVDSSVAALLLRRAGHDVVGVTMKLWGGDSDTGCCSVSDVDDARRVAQQLDIDHLVFNFGEDFDEHVVDPYVDAHRTGITPNPCIECNRSVKFARLAERAELLGFDAVATGHHARIGRSDDGRYTLERGYDAAKDQSYVVHMLDQAQLACDALARFQRLEGHEVTFITGVDEHGQKIQRTAADRGLNPQEHCDVISQRYVDLWQRWGISNDRFVRTTASRHLPLVEAFFQRCEANGDIRIGRQTGWYCVGCEEFKDDPADAKDPSCPLHKKSLEWRDEENLFFCLSNFQDRIEQLIDQPAFIAPANRRREIQNFVAGGLRDFSISRVNVSWGLPVPGHPGHTFYVWFDALLGYLTALLDDGGTVDLDRLATVGWPAQMHVIGKDILRFHAVYWPAMLMSAGLPVPERVFGHGFLTREGQKMGKSLGNVLDPEELLQRCGTDAVRWYLLRDIQFGDDGDFQQQRFTDLVNNDLANTIGNLLNRTASMARKWFSDGVPPAGSALDSDHPLRLQAEATVTAVREAMPEMAFQRASEAVLQLAIQANGFLNDRAPWSQMKQPGQEEAVGSDLYAVLECCRLVGLLLNPLVPDLSERILMQLDQGPMPQQWNDSLTWGMLGSHQPLPKPNPVMQRLELETPL